MSLYLDHNAGTPVDPRVLERFLEVEERHAANPSSLHRSGRAAHAVLEEAREEVAGALGVEPKSVLFVSGGTEANNLAVLGSGDPSLPVLLAPLEHPSVLDAAEPRGRVLCQVTSEGRARLETPETAVGLVCLVHGQNELGSIQPIEHAARLARELGVPLHVDAAQSLGRVPLDRVLELADTITLSSHKVGGLRGSGILIARRPEALRPLLLGGQQEGGVRAGTQSPALAAASARAVRLALEEQEQRGAAMADASEAFLEVLADAASWRCLTPKERLPNTLMICFGKLDGRLLLPALDLAGVQASQGSACSAGSPNPPAVLAAIGLDPGQARRCVRFSFSHHTTPNEASRAARIVVETVGHLHHPS